MSIQINYNHSEIALSNKQSLTQKWYFIQNFICTYIPCQDHKFQSCQSKIYPAPEIIWHICVKKPISRNGTTLSIYKKKNSNNLHSINDENNTNDENEDISDEDEEIPESPMFHTDGADMLQDMLQNSFY